MLTGLGRNRRPEIGEFLVEFGRGIGKRDILFAVPALDLWPGLRGRLKITVSATTVDRPRSSFLRARDVVASDTSLRARRKDDAGTPEGCARRPGLESRGRGYHLPETDSGATRQFSSLIPSTRENSLVLSVTKVKSNERACAAMSISKGPIGVPRTSREVRMIPKTCAAHSSNSMIPISLNSRSSFLCILFKSNETSRPNQPCSGILPR